MRPSPTTAGFVDAVTKLRDMAQRSTVLRVASGLVTADEAPPHRPDELQLVCFPPQERWSACGESAHGDPAHALRERLRQTMDGFETADVSVSAVSVLVPARETCTMLTRSAQAQNDH